MPRRALAHLAVAVVVAGSATITLFAAAHPSFLVAPSVIGHFPRWLSGPLHFPSLIPNISDAHARTGLTVVLLVMGVAWLLAVRLAEAVSARALWGAVLAAHTVIFLGPPVLGADIYGYLGYARLQVLQHANPYAHDLGTLGRHDPLFDWTSWHQLKTAYGPLFTLAVEPFAHLGVAGGVWALKTLAMAASLATLWLVWVAAGRLGRSPRVALAVCGLSPLWLTYALGGAHNDLVVAAAIAGTAVLTAASRPGRAGAAAVAGAAVKLSAAVLVPFVVLAASGARARGRALLGALAGAAGTLVIVALAFSGELPSIDTQTHFVVSLSVPNLLGVLFGARGVTPELRLDLDAVLAATVVIGAVRVWRGADWVAWGARATLALIASLTWVEPWYVVWLLPLAALARSRAVLIASLAMSVYQLLIWAPDTHTALVDAFALHNHNPHILEGVDVGDALRDGWPIAFVVAAALVVAGAVAIPVLRTRRSAS